MCVLHSVSYICIIYIQNFRGSALPLPKGGGAQALQFWGSLLFMHTHPLMQNNQIWCGNTWGGFFLKWLATPHPKGVGSQHSSILVVPFHLCVYPLSQNYQISHGNTWGRGLFLSGQPRPHPKGAGSALPNFGGSLLFMHTPFVAALLNLMW